MKLSNKQLKNKIDKTTLINSLWELVVMTGVVAGIYFLTGIQDIEFGIYEGIVVATARVLIKLLEEIKKGE